MDFDSNIFFLKKKKRLQKKILRSFFRLIFKSITIRDEYSFVGIQRLVFGSQINEQKFRKCYV